VIEGNGLGGEFAQYGPGDTFLKSDDIIFINVGIFYDNQKIGLCFRRIFRQLAAVQGQTGDDQQLTGILTILIFQTGAVKIIIQSPC
jgi:hypothetical protein